MRHPEEDHPLVGDKTLEGLSPSGSTSRRIHFRRLFLLCVAIGSFMLLVVLSSVRSTIAVQSTPDAVDIFAKGEEPAFRDSPASPDDNSASGVSEVNAPTTTGGDVGVNRPNNSETHSETHPDEEELKTIQADQNIWASAEVKDWKKDVRDRAQACRDQLARKDTLSTEAYEQLAADCGLGYEFDRSPAKIRDWTVVFYRSENNMMTLYTNCPLAGVGGCPLSPKCSTFVTDNKAQLKRADVVVIFQKEPRLVEDVPYDAATRRPYRVVLWREALWRGPRPPLQEAQYDFEIGSHHTAANLDPHWLLPPSDLLSGKLFSEEPIQFIPVQQRPNFAMSVISNCEAPSKRDYYQKHLTRALGPGKVHRYGECGNRPLPPRPISNAAKLIAQYKFYFSFENTIQEGYMTEKLIEILSLPVLPVYYGDPIVLNITKTPSFIKASDFATPEKLAEYLLYLDANPEEYNKYHTWRSNPTPFASDYLHLLRDKVAGPLEVEQYLDSVDLKDAGSAQMNFRAAQRRAQCCRLCDANFAKQAKASRSHIIPVAWSAAKINHRLFQDKMFDIPSRDIDE